MGHGYTRTESQESRSLGGALLLPAVVPEGEAEVDVAGVLMDFLARKFEAKFSRVELFVAPFAEGFHVLTGGRIETLRGPGFTRFLDFFESSRVFFALAAQPVFLDAQIIELALVGEEDFGFDELFADGLFFVGEQVGQFQATEGVDAGFARRNALEAPFGVSQRLDQMKFGFACRLVMVAEAGEVGFVENGVFGREQDGAARQSRFGIDLSVGGHRKSFPENENGPEREMPRPSLIKRSTRIRKNGSARAAKKELTL